MILDGQLSRRNQGYTSIYLEEAPWADPCDTLSRKAALEWTRVGAPSVAATRREPTSTPRVCKVRISVPTRSTCSSRAAYAGAGLVRINVTAAGVAALPVKGPLPGTPDPDRVE